MVFTLFRCNSVRINSEKATFSFAVPMLTQTSYSEVSLALVVGCYFSPLAFGDFESSLRRASRTIFYNNRESHRLLYEEQRRR